ncbi:MAG: hypothetical protein H0T41_03420 [Rhodobacteraceae bacterium]|nr:hypothetical protein [Paracoccaceae bacterium]
MIQIQRLIPLFVVVAVVPVFDVVVLGFVAVVRVLVAPGASVGSRYSAMVVLLCAAASGGIGWACGLERATPSFGCAVLCGKAKNRRSVAPRKPASGSEAA